MRMGYGKGELLEHSDAVCGRGVWGVCVPGALASRTRGAEQRAQEGWRVGSEGIAGITEDPGPLGREQLTAAAAASAAGGRRAAWGKVSWAAVVTGRTGCPAVKQRWGFHRWSDSRTGSGSRAPSAARGTWRLGSSPAPGPPWRQPSRRRAMQVLPQLLRVDTLMRMHA